MVETVIKAGVCGFTTRITADSEDMQNVNFSFETDCPNIGHLAEDFPVVDAYEEIGAGFSGMIHKRVTGVLKGCCAGCIVPSGIFKTMQVVAGLALPRPASINISKE